MTETTSERLLSDEDRRTALRIARAALEQKLGLGPSLDRLREGLKPSAPLEAQRGVFVTLHVPTGEGRGRLRGCIGHMSSSHPLHEAVAEIACHSALRDPRFPPLTPDELPGVSIEVSALTPMRPVPGPEDFRPGPDGVEIEMRGLRAVFLPQVAPEQGWTREETLDHLCRKAGLPVDAWRSAEARLQTFQAEVFGEGEPGMPPEGGDREARA